MAAPIDLDLLDTPILEQTEFGPDMKRWLSNIVDIINDDLVTLNQAFANLITAQGVDAGGAGATAVVPVIGLTASGFVTATLVSTSNPNITIVSIVPGLNQFTINFSGDPGASAIIFYKAFSANPQ